MFVGIVGDVVGFFLYATIFVLWKQVSYRFFVEEMFLGTDLFRSQILTGSILLNIVLFYVFMRKKQDDLNRGLIVVILLTIMPIVYYYE